MENRVYTLGSTHGGHIGGCNAMIKDGDKLSLINHHDESEYEFGELERCSNEPVSSQTGADADHRLMC